MNECEVQSLEALQRRIQQLDPQGIWIFRGQPNASWDLVPSLYRGLEKKSPSYLTTHANRIAKMEHDVYRKFTQLVWRYYKPTSKWEEICLAQHYGVPTRLLDWTRHPLKATYFAVNSTANTPAAVWCFDISKYPFPSFLGRVTNEVAHRVDLLNLISSKRKPSFLQTLSTQFLTHSTQTVTAISRDLESFDKGFLVVLDPPHFDPRIAAQAGLFSLHYSFDDQDIVWNHSRYLEAVESQMGLEMLHRIIIPGHVKHELCTALERMAGIDWHELFPDLPGVGMYLSTLKEHKFMDLCKG